MFITPFYQIRTFCFALAIGLYKKEVLDNPKTFAEEILKQKFTDDVVIEWLPIGIIIYLNRQDYTFLSRDSNPTPGDGVTLSNNWLPQILRGRIAILNKGDEVSGFTTKEELTRAKRHELSHVIYEEFHAQQRGLRFFDTGKALARARTEQEYQEISKMLYEDFVEKAKDEIIAYFSTGTLDESPTALRVHQYQWHTEGLEESLSERTNISDETKQNIINYFANDQRRCFEAIKKIRLVAEEMYKSRGQGMFNAILVESDLSINDPESEMKAAEVLLRNTPGTKIYRLARYTNVTSDEIKSGESIRKKEQDAIDAMEELRDPPERYNEEWWDNASRIQGQMKEQLPVNSLPALLKAASKWSVEKWTSFWAERAILLIESYIEIYGAKESDRLQIKETMNTILEKSDPEIFRDARKFAQKVLDLIS